MSNTLLVSTRKGLFIVERMHGEWNIVQTAFLGDNVALTSVDSRNG